MAHVRGIHVDMEEAVQATCAKQGKKLEEVTQLCLDSSCKSTHIKVRVASKRTWDGEKKKDEHADEERLERRSRKRCVENHLRVEPVARNHNLPMSQPIARSKNAGVENVDGAEKAHETNVLDEQGIRRKKNFLRRK